MKKFNISILWVLGIPVILLVLLLVKLLPPETTYKTVKISNVTVKAEVADTALKQTVGLMDKKSLPQNQGMIFIFDNEGYTGIWMINMSFPIDIIWIDKNLKIVDIVKDAQPCAFDCIVYYPSQKSLYVLEVNSGFVSKNKVEIGDSIKIT